MNGNRKTETVKRFAAARNTCKLCAPLGASLVYRGISGCVPLIHGSQGCATYIRRYLISHFREPVDIASSSFSESSAVFGGGNDLFTALDNIIDQYAPAVIGVATTCLSETMGEDVGALIEAYRKSRNNKVLPELVQAATPSYRGDHMLGFHRALNAVVRQMARGGPREKRLNVFGGFFSCSDLRYLHDVLSLYGMTSMILPDYSETLDGPSWEYYEKIPAGGTEVPDIARAGRASATLVLGSPASESVSAASFLEDNFGPACFACEYPVGIENTDRFHAVLSEVSGQATDRRFLHERGRLVDAYIDAHKYLSGIRAVLFGEEDLVCALASFLNETGIIVAAAATGGSSPGFKERLEGVTGNSSLRPLVLQDADHCTLVEDVRELSPDIIIGSSKGSYTAEQLAVPLVRCGFPVHDRFGAQRLRHLGYGGTQELFDRIVNAVIEHKQAIAGRRYSYL